MTITELARMTARSDSCQRQLSQQPKLPNGSLPPPGHVNPWCPPGMDITGMTKDDYKIIPVSKEFEQRIKDITLEQMKKHYGMSGTEGNPIADTIKAYDKLIPVGDRINAGWTLEQIHLKEARKLVEFVQSRIPGWQRGDAFNTSILDEYQQGIDTRA